MKSNSYSYSQKKRSTFSHLLLGCYYNLLNQRKSFRDDALLGREWKEGGASGSNHHIRQTDRRISYLKWHHRGRCWSYSFLIPLPPVPCVPERVSENEQRTEQCMKYSKAVSAAGPCVAVHSLRDGRLLQKRICVRRRCRDETRTRWSRVESSGVE